MAMTQAVKLAPVSPPNSALSPDSFLCLAIMTPKISPLHSFKLSYNPFSANPRPSRQPIRRFSMTSSPHPLPEVEAAWQLHERLSRYMQLIWDRYESQFIRYTIQEVDHQFYMETQGLADDFAALADLELDDDIPF
jgi:hypothetical protein